MKVLALAAYPERVASTRFRVSRYLPHLASRGIEVDLLPWLDDATAARLYERGGLGAKIARGFRGLANQLEAVSRDYDAVWVQREAVLAGPPLIEALVRSRRLPLVLDYDDAVWVTQGGAMRRVAKFSWKFDWVLRRATHALPGSERLAERARGFGVPTTVLPTIVERELWTPLAADGRDPDPARPLLIGWIGSHSTARQLALAAPALRRLRDEGYRFRVLVIGASLEFRVDGVEIETRPWSLEHEIDDFRTLDIGLTPMFSSPWYEGKCGFKQIQLMSVGVPFVSSLVGGARDFLVDEENTLLAHTEDDWYRQLKRLLTDPALRQRLGRAGRTLVEDRLCIEEQVDTLAQVLRSAAATPQRASVR